MRKKAKCKLFCNFFSFCQPQKYSSGAFGTNINKLEGEARAKKTQNFWSHLFKKAGKVNFRFFFQKIILGKLKWLT